MIVDKIPAEEGPKVPTIPDIPEEKVTSEKGYYHSVYVILYFKKEAGVDRKEEQADVEYYPDEENMEDVKLDDERERHWRMVSRTMMEGWTIRRHLYMLRGGMYT